LAGAAAALGVAVEAAAAAAAEETAAAAALEDVTPAAGVAAELSEEVAWEAEAEALALRPRRCRTEFAVGVFAPPAMAPGPQPN